MFRWWKRRKPTYTASTSCGGGTVTITAATGVFERIRNRKTMDEMVAAAEHEMRRRDLDQEQGVNIGLRHAAKLVTSETEREAIMVLARESSKKVKKLRREWMRHNMGEDA